MFYISSINAWKVALLDKLVVMYLFKKFLALVELGSLLYVNKPVTESYRYLHEYRIGRVHPT